MLSRMAVGFFFRHWPSAVSRARRWRDYAGRIGDLGRFFGFSLGSIGSIAWALAKRQSQSRRAKLADSVDKV